MHYTGSVAAERQRGPSDQITIAPTMANVHSCFSLTLFAAAGNSHPKRCCFTTRGESSVGRRTHFLSQQVLRVGSINFADVMPQCGEDGRQGEDLNHSTGLQKTSPSHFY